jgi:hypothetical protein
MKTYLAIFALLLTTHSIAQTCGTLVSHSAIPSPIYDTTEAKVNLQVYCHENIWLDHYNITQNGNDFTIEAYYCYGWLQVITTSNDSLSLGVLPPGNFTYNAIISVGYHPQTNCLDQMVTDSGSGSFSVEPTSGLGIVEHNSQEPHLIKIVDLTGREVEPAPNTLLIYIYSDGTTEKVYYIK